MNDAAIMTVSVWCSLNGEAFEFIGGVENCLDRAALLARLGYEVVSVETYGADALMWESEMTAAEWEAFVAKEVA